MKKLYYFSKSKLQFIEIQNYKKKLTAYLGVSAAAVIALVFVIFYFISSFSTSGNSLFSLKTENKELKEKIAGISENYKTLNDELENLYKVNNDLRIAANLPPVSSEERMVGIGGGSFDNNLDFIKGSQELDLKKALAYADEVSRKLEFEKNQYFEIKSKIADNQRLFEAIPAIKPCTGTVDEKSFGMRMHPILHIMKMHEGIDIITDMGTSVYTTGKGVVDFVGYKGGYGLAVEIDHGYGYRTTYGHLQSTVVKVGQKVSRGDKIAFSGNSGLSSGPHLHYEVAHNGIKENPAQFFFDDAGFFELTNKNNIGRK